MLCTSCGARLGASHIFCPKCGNRIERNQIEEQQQHRQRVLPVDGDTLKLLKEYIRRGGPVVKKGKRLIFGINRHRAWQIIKGCAEKAGLPKLINPETGRYSIDKVMGPDEFHESYPDANEGGLRDNAYTNIMVAWMFEKAKEMIGELSNENLKSLEEKIGYKES